MPHFSDFSTTNLETCHPDLQRLFLTVIRFEDCRVLSGWRGRHEQAGLYAQGRTEPGDIVTNCDGVTKLSNHQGIDGNPPGLAVDCVPYPVDWNGIDRMIRFGGFVLGVASQLDIDLEWGGDWKTFKDYPHFELIP